jgi:hypothetical protein
MDCLPENNAEAEKPPGMLDDYHKFGSRWFCLQMREAFEGQAGIIAKLLDLPKDEKLQQVIPLILGIRDSSNALVLLRRDRLLNEAHVLMRLLTERVVNFCFLLVAEPSEIEVIQVRDKGGEAKPVVNSAGDLIELAKDFHIAETYDAEALEKKLAVLKARSKVHIDFLRVVIASHYPIAAAALSGSPFGASCHLKQLATGNDADEFFQQEFALLFFSGCSLLHEAITVAATILHISTLISESEEVLQTAADLMNRIKKPVQPNILDAEGQWNNLEDLEFAAKERLSKELSGYGKAFGLCAEAGIEVTCLDHDNRGCERLMLSALFLKRVLNDLRGVWLLLSCGYTSQAASIAASLYENALAARCIAISDERASKLKNCTLGQLPWSKKEMCKIITQDEMDRGEASLSHEDGWKLLYGQYSWLCEIKHPTLQQAIHDAGATAHGKSGYVVMALPDVREDNFGMKMLICLIVLTTSKAAIQAFARAVGVKEKSDNEKRFAKTMEDIDEFLTQQLRKDKASVLLPFGIRDTAWGKKNLSRKSS